MRRALLAGAATTLAVSLAAFAPGSSAAVGSMTLGPIVRITTPGTSLCPAEGEPEVTHTRLGTWVAYNDDHQCPADPTFTRLTGLQLVPSQGRPVVIPLPGTANASPIGDPDLVPAPDGGVYLSSLLDSTKFVGEVSLRIMHVDAHLHVHVLPSPSYGKSHADDKEFIAVDNRPGSPYRGRLYAAWDNFATANQTVFRAWTGTHWTTPVVLQPQSGIPDVAVGPDGDVAVAMTSCCPTDIAVMISHDGGAHFDDPIKAIKGADPGYVDPSCPLRPTVGIRQRADSSPRVAYDQQGDLHVVASIGTWLLDLDTQVDVRQPAVVQHAVIRGRRVVKRENVAPAFAQANNEQWAPALAPLPSGGVAVSWLQTTGAAHSSYDAWIAVEKAGANAFATPQRLSVTSSLFPAAMEAIGNSNCYGVGDYIGMTTTPDGVATVWPTTDTDVPGVDSDVLLRTARLR